MALVVKALLGHLLFFPELRRGLKIESPLEEYQRLVDLPQQPCGRILKYLLFN